MTVELTLADRLGLLSVLPPQTGSFREMRLVGGLRSRIELADETAQAIGLQADETGIRWNARRGAEAVPPATFEFSDEEVRVMAEGFLLLEASKQVPTDTNFIALYDKFETAIEQQRS